MFLQLANSGYRFCKATKIWYPVSTRSFRNLHLLFLRNSVLYTRSKRAYVTPTFCGERRCFRLDRIASEPFSFQLLSNPSGMEWNWNWKKLFFYLTITDDFLLWTWRVLFSLFCFATQLLWRVCIQWVMQDEKERSWKQNIVWFMITKGTSEQGQETKQTQKPTMDEEMHNGPLLRLMMMGWVDLVPFLLFIIFFN